MLDLGASTRVKTEPSGVIVTMSPSSGNCTWRVSFRNAAAFEARNISPLPIPTTSGVWCRAATAVGVVVVDDDEVKWPSSCANVRRTASVRSPS